MGRAALALARLDPADPELDRIDFATWLRRNGQSERAVEALWDLVGVATLNATAPNASMALAAKVFKTGLLSEPGAADIGWAAVPLGDLHDTLARKALDTAASAPSCAPRRVPSPAARTAAGPWRARGSGSPPTPSCSPCRRPRPTTCSPRARSTSPSCCSTSTTRPSSTCTSFTTARCCAGPSSPRSAPRSSGSSTAPTLGPDRPGQYVAVSQSAAQDEIDLPVADLRARYLPELERLLPAARGAGVRDFFVTRSAPPPSRPPRASDGCAPAPAPGCPASSSRGLDRHRLARDDGGRRAQRRRRADAALHDLGRPPGHPLQEAA